MLTAVSTAWKRNNMANRTKEASRYRSIRHLRKGGLHKALGIPEGEAIPKEKVAAALKSKNAHVRQMAEFAHSHSGFDKVTE